MSNPPGHDEDDRPDAGVDPAERRFTAPSPSDAGQTQVIGQVPEPETEVFRAAQPSRDVADANGLSYDYVAAWITLQVHSSLAAVGLTASFSAALAQAGVIEFPQSEEIPTATKPVAVYVFSGERGRRDSIVLVAQLSPEFTAALVSAIFDGDKHPEQKKRSVAGLLRLHREYGERLEAACRRALALQAQIGRAHV